MGNWLTVEECHAVRAAADVTTLTGCRDRAMLSLLFGCGLRRAELVALELRDLQRREDHWVLVDLIGKGKHIRTVPVPNWVQAAVAAWTTVAQSRRAVYSAAPDATGASGAAGSPIRWYGTW